MKSFICFLVLFIGLVTISFAKYIPNGPPLHVSAGAVPLEPNTDKLPQQYYRNTEYKGNEPLLVIANSKEEFEKGVKYLPVKEEYNEDFMYVFYYHGIVPKREENPNPPKDELKIAARVSCEIFGVERLYTQTRTIQKDEVVTYVVDRNVGPNMRMFEHYPGVVFKMRYSALDTEFDKTPPITDKTVFTAVIHQVTTTKKGPFFKR